jgi:hypothetical protein
MAKSRRKSGGCNRGRFKRKKLGKGYSTLRQVPHVERPKPKTEGEQTIADGGRSPKG